MFAFYCLFQILVIFLQSDVSGARLLTYVIENVMGKDLTFTDRARVWLVAIEMIKDSPLTGYGMRDGDWFETYFYVLSAHNIIFQMLIYGGIVLFGYFVIMIFCSVCHALKETATLTYTLLLGLCTTFIMMMMENYNLVLILYLFCIIYYSNMLSKSVHQRRASARKEETTMSPNVTSVNIIQPCELPDTQ
jgi:O-antigen ligase